MTTTPRPGATAPATAVTASPGQGRAAARTVDAVALLTPPLAFAVPVLLVRAGQEAEGFLFLNLASLLISVLVAFYGHLSWHARPLDGGLLSARTLTGRRTVDLARLTKVGRVEVPGPRLDDRLVLTDAHGVRLIVHLVRGGGDTVDATVRRALLNRPAGAGVVVSHRAAERLGLSADLTREHGRLRPGRRVLEGLIGWLPLLSLLVGVPAMLGLTVLAWILAHGT
ncbi:hypothetical protein [Streptomyces flavofungini]|uniref:hypothetical protein n=1 Tax=Streptomyces flavofungini TaxID=68200 RepID=UPI0034DF33DD